LVITADGHICLQTERARDLLFMAHHVGLGPPLWVLPDRRALPPEVARAVQELFENACETGRREIRMRQDWGAFDFTLEKATLSRPVPQPGVVVTIRHYEPLDITVARKLWGWSLSPQEKRIVVASARNPRRAELASALGLSEGTLRYYINELHGRMGVASRQEIIERVLAESPPHA